MVTVVLVPVGMALDRGITNFYYEQNSREMLDLGRRLADFIQRASDPGATEAVRSIAQLAGTPIMVLDADARVTTGSGALTSEVGRRVQTPQVRTALDGEASVVLAVDETLPGSLFVAAVPVWSETTVRGVVLLFRSADEVRGTLKQTRTLLAFSAGVLFVLTSVLAWLLSRWFVRPVLYMKDATDRMAGGDYTIRVGHVGGEELKELADAIDRLGESLHSLEKGRRSFFANVSHELRTPLSYVRGYSEAIAQGLFENKEEAMEVGQVLVEESRRLSRLVDDLFDLAQAEEGRLRLEVEPVALDEAAQKIVSRMKSVAEQKKIHLETHFRKSLWAEVDPLRFEQIMVNLLDNALRYTPAGGSVRVSGDEEPAGVIIIMVEDSGEGLHEPGRVWERFYREDASRNRNLGGSGLGLSIVKSLVELHGGDVFADNDTELGGARFGFRFRLYTDSARPDSSRSRTGH